MGRQSICTMKIKVPNKHTISVKKFYLHHFSVYFCHFYPGTWIQVNMQIGQFKAFRNVNLEISILPLNFWVSEFRKIFWTTKPKLINTIDRSKCQDLAFFELLDTNYRKFGWNFHKSLKISTSKISGVGRYRIFPTMVPGSEDCSRPFCPGVGHPHPPGLECL